MVIALRLGTSLRKGVRSCVFTKRRTVVRLYVRTKSHRNLLDVPSLRYTHVPSLRYKSHRYLLDVNPIRVLFNKLDRSPHSRARISVLEPTGSGSVSLEESSLQICLKASC